MAALRLKAEQPSQIYELLKKKVFLTRKTPLFKITKSLFLNRIQAFRFFQNLPIQQALV